MDKIKATPEQIAEVIHVTRRLAWVCFFIGVGAGIIIGKVVL